MACTPRRLPLETEQAIVSAAAVSKLETRQPICPRSPQFQSNPSPARPLSSAEPRTPLPPHEIIIPLCFCHAAAPEPKSESRMGLHSVCMAGDCLWPVL